MLLRSRVCVRIVHQPLVARANSTQTQSASAKLWADAAEEEDELAARRKRQQKVDLLFSKDENWTGDESMRDGVLRMLVDKYKPLRQGPIKTAEEKLRERPPQIASAGSSAAQTYEPVAQAPTAELQDIKPWMVTFKPPSFIASIRTGNITSSKPSKKLPASALEAPMTREQRKRMKEAGRLTSAREASLDYRLRMPTDRPRANPVTLRGWGSLVEERIERARNEGHFRSLNGRGKPLVRDTAEGNPFIGREQFLMNRIVKRNGAAPPWVEVQGELESAVNSFRDVMQASWVRTATRTLSASRPRTLLASIPREEIAALRDAGWETRERTFHEAALDDVNRIVRKHNGIAPVPVRKGYLTRDVELERCYRVSVDAIHEELAARAQEPVGVAAVSGSEGAGGDGADAGSDLRIGTLFRDLVRRVVARFVGPL